VPTAGALLALAALAAYANSFAGPMVFDDIPSIRENPTIRDLRDFAAVLSPPNNAGETVSGRPLVNLSLALNYAVGGLAPFGYHLVNLLIHVAAGLALFGVLRRSFELPRMPLPFPSPTLATPPLASASARTAVAFTIAALWLLHPLQTESVTYLIQRAEALMGLFYLLTLYLFVRSVGSAHPGRWQTLSVAACFCGMATKEVMVSAPLLVLLYDRALVGGTFRAAWRARAWYYVGLAASWFVLIWLAQHAGTRGGTAGLGTDGVNAWSYALTQCLAIGKYLKLSVWPSPLVFDYGVRVEEALLPVLPQALVLVALVGATAYALWKNTVLGWIGAWFFAILAPSSSVIPVVSQPIAEHRMYLPLAAVLALAVWAAVRWGGQRAVALGLALAVAAGFATRARNTDYQSDTALWKATLRDYPTSARAHANVGLLLSTAGRHDDAAGRHREAARLLGDAPARLNNIGNNLTHQGRARDALPYLERAVALDPQVAKTRYNLAGCFLQLGRGADAIPHYEAAVRLNPTLVEAHNNLAVVLAETGRPADALPHHREVLRLRPDYPDAHFNLGNTLNTLGHAAEAAAAYAEEIRRHPAHAKALYRLGTLALRDRRADAARQHFAAALRAQPDFRAPFSDVAHAHLRAGRLADAQIFLESVLAVVPDDARARALLAEAHAQLAAQPAATRAPAQP
jgi:tetratricopeptide (TPR) repeat protein